MTHFETIDGIEVISSVDFHRIDNPNEKVLDLIDEFLTQQTRNSPGGMSEGEVPTARELIEQNTDVFIENGIDHVDSIEWTTDALGGNSEIHISGISDSNNSVERVYLGSSEPEISPVEYGNFENEEQSNGEECEECHTITEDWLQASNGRVYCSEECAAEAKTK